MGDLDTLVRRTGISLWVDSGSSWIFFINDALDTVLSALPTISKLL